MPLESGWFESVINCLGYFQVRSVLGRRYLDESEWMFAEFARQGRKYLHLLEF